MATTGDAADDTGESGSVADGNESTSSASAVTKTPVSLLQELYVRRGITPKYDLVQIEGAIHEPTFKYRVTVGEFVATGCGQSKKKAKHAAAKSVLDKIRAAQQKCARMLAADSGASGESFLGAAAANSENSSGGNATTALVAKVADLNIAELSVDVASPYDDGIGGNPVGELQELCMHRRMQQPVYEVSLEEGQPHERKFVIVCSVGPNQQEAGVGKSKKLAKRQSASKMLKRLQSMPNVDFDGTKNSFQSVDEDELAQGIALRRSRDARGHRQDFIRFYRGMQSSEGSKLAALNRTSIDDLRAADCEKILEGVATEHDFPVTYIEIEEVSKDGKRHALVQMNTIPVAVCYGIGKTLDAAKANAAFNACEYLKIMVNGLLPEDDKSSKEDGENGNSVSGSNSRSSKE